MIEKYDPDYERRLAQLAEHRLESGNYRVFDFRARALKRERIPNLQSHTENALVVINGEGDVMILTEEFERMLYSIGKKRFE